MILKRADRLAQEINILSGRTISVDYLINVFEVSRASILEDLKTLKKKGYDVKKVDWGCYTIKNKRIDDVIKEKK